MTSDNPDLLRALLQRPSERTMPGIARNLILGAAIGVLLIAVDAVRGMLVPGALAGDLIAGIAIAFLGWGAERMWYSIIAPMFARPFSPPAYLSRIPFWYFGGAIAFTIALLAEKKIGIRLVDDIPVKRLFDEGGKLGVIVQLPLQLVLYRSLTGRLWPAHRRSGGKEEIP